MIIRVLSRRWALIVSVASLLCWLASCARAAEGLDTPVSPEASPQAQALLAYLWDIYGKKILSGQQAGGARLNEPDLELTYIKTNTGGQLPAIRSWDLSPYTPPGRAKTSRLAVAECATNWYLNDHGIVALCWHWQAPVGRGGIYVKDTPFDLRQGLLPDTPENAAILRDLDTVAGELKKLRDARVPILWRPLHEASGRWFWWGARGDPQPFKDLWRLMFDRLVNYHHLNNLIWVYSPGAAVDLAQWYPGDEYVDIIGQDHYPMDHNRGPAKEIYDELVALGHGHKLVALSENGPIPDPDRLLEEKAGWLFFATWSGKMLWDLNSPETLAKVYHHPYVLTLQDLPPLRNYPFNAAGRAVKLGFVSGPGNLAVGHPGPHPVTVAVQDVNGLTVRNGDYLVSLSLDNQSRGGKLAGTRTARTINGVATFPNLTIDQPGLHYSLKASAPGLEKSISPAFQVGPGNGILREWWDRPLTIRDLATPGVLDKPDGTEVLGAALQVPYCERTNLAERIRGWLVPAVTGAYELDIIGDGDSELWLGSDETADKKAKLAEITGSTPYSKWPHSHEQWSPPVTLIAGHRYRLEILHTLKSGGTALWVGWRLPNGALQQPIPAANLALPSQVSAATSLETSRLAHAN